MVQSSFQTVNIFLNLISHKQHIVKTCACPQKLKWYKNKSENECIETLQVTGNNTFYVEFIRENKGEPISYS